MRYPRSPPGYGLTPRFHNAAARTGVFCWCCACLWSLPPGCLSRTACPHSRHFALERNLVAAAALGLFALVPVLRFLRLPGHLLASSLIAWSYSHAHLPRLCVHFAALNERYSAPQVFIAGRSRLHDFCDALLDWHVYLESSRIARFCSIQTIRVS